MTRFDGKTVLITGAGSGLGRAAAVRVASEGAKLSLVDLSADGLAETRRAIQAVNAEAQVLTITADVTDAEQVESFITHTVSEFTTIDGFFNNAGIEGKQNLTEDFGLSEFDKVLAVNLRGVFLGLSGVLKVMRAQGSGHVVNSASVGGIRGVGNQSGYAAAKHGVVGLTRNSGTEYGKYGITVNAIAPGAIWTSMVEGSMKQLNEENPREAAEEFIQSNPTKRYGEADEVAAVVAFLLSDEASYVNSTVIPIDGGQSAAY
ncbi:SDR family oxidoreductase [Nesterenkonia halotolerans]|uniref:NAD(P)-dependent dehydrogenase (Short-subunit alcohol dehydrogenase family) n=1 Tax=Nesterenkonia halotolerans TaxID=225325 RepID=A0ABR9J801_9MICC|nr:SDR family oxidoreductase [Nesterenkonia halotolerans]MBE1515113.1 NAD(P)-dependent dehydrogenase (short-subunit alcohol dehydrogenase family) [Nesterenkonia halotolerans]